MTRNLKISFTYSLDDNLLTIYINKIKKLVELKFNITTLNNLNVILSYNHIRPTNDVSELKIDELVYLLADEQLNQNGENPKQAFLFKCYFEIDNEFKKQLGAFLLDRLNDYYCLKLERIQGQLDVMQLKEHWLRIVDQNTLVVNESNLTSINTLGFYF